MNLRMPWYNSPVTVFVWQMHGGCARAFIQNDEIGAGTARSGIKKQTSLLSNWLDDIRHGLLFDVVYCSAWLLLDTAFGPLFLLRFRKN